MSFSVVIPLYNKAAHIEDCLRSVLKQSFPAQEIIVVDDGSQDHGPKLVLAFEDRRVRLVRQRNSGPGVARNTGIAEAQSPWVSFIDADDLWHTNHLLIHSEAVTQYPQAGMFGSRFRRSKFPLEGIKALKPNIGCSREVDYIEETARRLLAEVNEKDLIFSSSISVQTDLLRRIGGFTKVFPGEDTSTWLRLALRAPVVISDAETAIYRIQTDGIMDQKRDFSELSIFSHPLRLELTNSLQDPNFAGSHHILKRYLDSIDTNALKSALYNEKPIAARKLAAKMDVNAALHLGLRRHLLQMPNFLAVFFVRSFKIIRRMAIYRSRYKFWTKL